MAEALRLAGLALQEEEVPVGAVIVLGERIIGRGYNQTGQRKDPTAHAEILAIKEACSLLGERILPECSLYVTLEPCPMCAGAIVLGRLKRVIFGAADEKSGAGGTVFNLLANRRLNHQAEVIQGVMESECSRLLTEFFSLKR